jgi:hypothetical protein
MKRFLGGVLKINMGMQTIAAISLTFIILLTTVDVVVRIFGKPVPGAPSYLRRAQLAYIRERITYWGKQGMDRKLKSPYVQ